MVKTGKELRKQLILTAARDYQDWNNRRRFWRRVSITCAALAVFFAGVAVGGALS
jgi:anti-sigma-K factor RskA